MHSKAIKVLSAFLDIKLQNTKSAPWSNKIDWQDSKMLIIEDIKLYAGINDTMSPKEENN